MATEVGVFSSDMLVIRNGSLVEIEIKVSKADLTADFKKRKHLAYKTKSAGKYELPWIPHFFYFAVPYDDDDLIKHALVKSLPYGYGVIAVKDYNNVRVVKRAKRLHNSEVSEEVKRYVVARLMSEMANLRLEQQTWERERAKIKPPRD